MMDSDYQRIEKAIHYLEEHFREQPALEDLARHLHLSPFHFQRLFSRWAGISPKRFLQFLTLDYAKKLLAEKHSHLEAAYQAGLSGPSRLHDLFVTIEGVTPGEFRSSGAGLTIRYGVHPSPFGECLLALTGRGICGLAFIGPAGRKAALEELQARWPEAELEESPADSEAAARQVFGNRRPGRSAPGCPDPGRSAPGCPDPGRSAPACPDPGCPDLGRSGPAHPAAPLRLFLKGTHFQIKVWEALLRIPPGFVSTYRDVARAAGSPRAVRAAGQAVGANPVAYLIPCHRVIRATGAFGRYRYGTARKQAMLAWEQAVEESSS